MMRYVKHPPALLGLIASLLIVVASISNLLAERDRSDSYKGLTWRARFVAEYRRHPRLRATSMACLAVALPLLISYFVVLFG
jgi:hypothetical protein